MDALGSFDDLAQNLVVAFDEIPELQTFGMLMRDTKSLRCSITATPHKHRIDKTR